MRIYFPKKMISEKVFKGFKEMGYDSVGNTSEFVVFEGVFPLKIPAESLGLSLREFARLCRLTKIEGGKKARVGGALSIEPYRSRRFTVRLSSEEYEALLQVAESRGYSRRSLSTFFRNTLLLSLSTRLEQTGRI